MILDQIKIKEEIKKELFRCKNDIIYFLKTYAKIQHPSRGKIPFKLYPFQEKVLEAFQANRFNIILKGRQLGLSTLISGFLVHQMMFKEDYIVLCIATKTRTAIDLVKKVSVILDGLPPWLRPPIDSNNKQSIELKNGSRVFAVSSKSDAARSTAASLMIIDEAAFIRDIDEVWTAAFPILSTGGSAIVNSTPNGVGNWYHRMWQSAEEGSSNFFPIKLPWYVHPERDQAWRDEQDVELKSKKKAAQENDGDFISSGNTVIDGDIILSHKQSAKEPLFKLGVNEDLWIWKEPEYGEQYLISVDNAEPGGTDFSAAQIINIMTLEQVGEYKGNISLRDFGKMLVDLAKQYNDAFLVIENNSIGLATIQSVLDEEYENLFWTKKGTLEYTDPKDIDGLMDDKTIKPGFSTTMKTRPLMIEKMRQMVVSREVRLNSLRTINEMWTFIYENGKPTHSKGNHDDLLLALSMGLWVRDVMLTKINLQDEINKQRENWIIERRNKKPQGLYGANQNAQPLEIDIGGEMVDVRELYDRRKY